MKPHNILEYKGYHTKVEFDAEGATLRGKIEGINDYVDFECESTKDVEKEFHNAVDDYLKLCKEVGKEPDKEYSGTFNVRINAKLHRQLANHASRNNESLNSCVEKAVEFYLNSNYARNNIFKAEDIKTESEYNPESEYCSNKIIPYNTWKYQKELQIQ